MMTTSVVEPVVAPTTGAQVRRTNVSLLSVIRWETRKLTHQWMTRAILVAAVVAPIPIGFMIHGMPQPPRDTLFGRYATVNGFSLALLLLGFMGQWVIPLLAAVVAGDVFASEDGHGTWKTVLTRSTSRAKIFWAKVIAACGFTVTTLVLLAGSTIVSSVVIGGTAPMTGVSGQLIDAHRAYGLVAAAWATSLPPAIGFTCLAVLLSAATRNTAAGIAAPAVIALAMQLLGALSPFAGSREVLLSTAFEAWHGLFAIPEFTGPIVIGLLVSALWSAACLAAAFIIIRRRDIVGG